MIRVRYWDTSHIMYVHYYLYWKKQTRNIYVKGNPQWVYLCDATINPFSTFKIIIEAFNFPPLSSTHPNRVCLSSCKYDTHLCCYSIEILLFEIKMPFLLLCFIFYSSQTQKSFDRLLNIFCWNWSYKLRFSMLRISKGDEET
jgi:hypothetical protein